ncbi:UMP kinase [Nanoarchaeota archaeon]
MKTFIISLGGSMIVPKEINVSYLKNLKNLILKHSKKNKFIIVVGGGSTARKYQKAGRELGLNSTDLDWVGIHTTWLNANFVRTVFQVKQGIVQNPTKKTNFKKILFAGGWKPGCSTDYDAVLLAKTYQAQTVINITNVPYLHNKNPKVYKNTKIIKQTDWKTLRKIIGNKWSPGLNTPFDPIAAKLAQKLKLKLYLVGSDIKNLDNLLQGEKFKGSIVQD